MCIRDRRLQRSDLHCRGLGTSANLSSREGCLARRASWDSDLAGWTLGPGPILTRGLSDRKGAGADEQLPSTLHARSCLLYTSPSPRD
eukprot:11837254-Alexandrium_andersonii.AAC.1